MALQQTFAYDEELPDLPLPSLKDTLNRYLDSIKPHVTDEEFLNTKKITESFAENEGPILHQRLVERSKTHRNWVNKVSVEKHFFMS